MSTEQIGRNIIYRNGNPKYTIKLSVFRKVMKKYYELRIKLVEKRMSKYGAYSGGFQLDLFNAAVYIKQSYLHKIEALYSKQEIRDFERRVRRDKKNNEIR